MNVNVSYSVSKSDGHTASYMELSFENVNSIDDSSNVSRIISQATTKDLDLPRE